MSERSNAYKCEGNEQANLIHVWYDEEIFAVSQCVVIDSWSKEHWYAEITSAVQRLGRCLPHISGYKVQTEDEIDRDGNFQTIMVVDNKTGTARMDKTKWEIGISLRWQ